MILVDTSVWVDHLRKGCPELAALLIEGEVCCHTFIIGEIACGNIENREEILSLLKVLPRVNMLEEEEVLFFIEKNKLMGKGLGLVDIHLLGSAMLSGVSLWTLDRRLRREANRLSLSSTP